MPPGWVFAVLVFAGIMMYALRNYGEVKAWLKIPFISFFFQARRRGKFSPNLSLKTPKTASNHHKEP